MKVKLLIKLITLPHRRHSTKRSRYNRSKPREMRQLFTIFCAALLLESIALQLITTADGSEVAFNPDPETSINRINPSPATGAVASVHPVQNQQSRVSETSNSTPTSSGPRALITHVSAQAPADPLTAPTLIFRSPLTNYTLTQYFSTYHPALDMAAPTGTTVYATTEGVVANTGYLLPGGGLMIKVDHDGGYSSYYAHLSAITSHIGQKVNNTTPIGRVGSTGWATGPHLHFMIWKDQQAVNPLSLLK